jgi:hypothetical protein
MNETNRELLELAAKAAGIELVWGRLRWGHRDDPFGADGFFQLTDDRRNYVNPNEFWNPLVDDGDALRLAVKLLFEIDMGRGSVAVRHSSGIKVLEAFNLDPYAATRRAIVRAAAEIGRMMK